MIEKGFEVRITQSFGCLLGVCRKFSQESKDLVRRYGFYLSFTEFDPKIAEDVAVIAQCIFF